MSHKIKKIRQRNGFSLEVLAEQVGLSEKTIRNFESNLTSPRLNDLQKISSALGVRLRDLLPPEPHSTHTAA